MTLHLGLQQIIILSAQYLTLKERRNHVRSSN
jgi:hypothetical protein